MKLLFCIFCTLQVVAQVPVKIELISSNRYYNTPAGLYAAAKMDTLEIQSDFELNGVRCFVDSTGIVDSAYRYFENNEVAYKGIRVNYSIDTVIYNSKSQRKPYVDIYEKTYYPYRDFEVTRSTCYWSYYKSKYLNFTRIFYNTAGIQVYEEVSIMGDTLKGSFLKVFPDQKDPDDKYGLCVYRNGKPHETWYFQNLRNHPEEQLLVTKIELHTERKILTEKKEITQKLECTKFYIFDNRVYIGNNENR
jgi:hypothetical protein